MLLGERWARWLGPGERARVETRLKAIGAVVADARSELFVSGRTSSASLRWLERRTASRTRALIERMKVPLYVILVGETPPGGKPTALDPERSPGLIFDMVRAANGAQAAPWAQSLSGFFGDDGVLLDATHRIESIPGHGGDRVGHVR